MNSWIFCLLLLHFLSVAVAADPVGFLGCSSSPCRNHGRCLDFPGGNFSCICDDDFVGEQCQFVNPCRKSFKRCKHGSCVVTGVERSGVTAECQCEFGYHGRLCEMEDDGNACRGDPCGLRGRCVLQSRRLDRFTCLCLQGYTGQFCNETDKCQVNPCLNAGTCHSTLRGYHCSCPAGFHGVRCHVDVNECLQPHVCLVGHVCVNTLGGYSCECPDGLTGRNCDELQIPCQANNCLNGGSCLQTGKRAYKCLCPTGFTGVRCEQNVDDCRPRNPCRNNGKCVDGVRSSSCSCPPQFRGTFCEDDVDECLSSPCRHGGTCINGFGYYRCECYDGWTGQDCEIHPNVCALNPCENGGTCTNVGRNSFRCNCPLGRIGRLCHMVDPCSQGHPCVSPGSECQGHPFNGTVYCRCAEGFNGSRCERDRDECAESQPCWHGRCVNTVGSFRCDCRATGYGGRLCDRDTDECASGPCLNGGTCDNTPGSFKCACPKSHTGRLCESEVNVCRRNPCQNGAACVSVVDERGQPHYRCDCRPGFRGVICNYQHDECESNPCRGGATCTDLVNGYTCTCPDGYTGVHCEGEVDNCASRPCVHGSCVSRSATYRCHCQSGWTGALCDVASDGCRANPCRRSAVCRNVDLDYKCDCPPGTDGKNCQNDVDECKSNPCLNSGTCSNTDGSFACKCKMGFNGNICQIDQDECNSAPCLNGGRCYDLVDGFQCRCNSGFSGRRCEVDVNECASFPCQNGGTCVNKTLGGFTCNCNQRFFGILCEQEFKSCDLNPCQHDATCVNRPDLSSKYQCICRAGYSGTHCQHNVLECSSNPCGEHGQCIDMVAEFACHCDPSWTGRLCTNFVNPCLPNPCQHGAECKAGLFNDFTCDCKDSWTGALCELDVDECAHPRCRNLGTCINTFGDYNCTCHRGYAGKNCQYDIDDCASEPCENGGYCFEINDSFLCECHEGYIGKYCETNIDECSSSPCQNGATCEDYLSSYACQCPKGFSGIHCEQNDDDCTNSSCLSGGRCIDGISSYTCNCPPEFAGTHCQHRVDLCSRESSCQNGGTCYMMRGNAYGCHCPAGFEGPRCESVVQWCETQPCGQHGSCLPSGKTFTCQCDAGYYGRLCEVKAESSTCGDYARHLGISVDDVCGDHGRCTDSADGVAAHFCNCHHAFTGADCSQPVKGCATSPCQNGASCKDLSEGYECECPSGFAGSRCESHPGRTNLCASNPCRGGTCVDLVDDFHCACPTGLSGALCEVSRDDCQSNPCRFNGTCFNHAGGYSCQCRHGYTGRQCEAKTDKCSRCVASNTLQCSQAKCTCKRGFSGLLCEKFDPCASQPCSGGSACVAKGAAAYECDALTRETEREVCATHNCSSKAMNSHCDTECNRSECNFDGNDCSLHPWSDCKNAVSCSLLFYNNECNEECSSRSCLDDGDDCHPAVKICPDEDCSALAYDGRCDRKCNNVACGFDGSDCDLVPNSNYSSGSMIVVVGKPASEFGKSDLVTLSRLLRAVVVVDVDEDGYEKVYELKDDERRRRKRASTGRQTEVHMRVDNSGCGGDRKCWPNSKDAANFVAALDQRGKLPQSLSFRSISATEGTIVPESSQWQLFLVVAAVIACVTVVGGVLARKRKRFIKCTNWYPEGFERRGKPFASSTSTSGSEHSSSDSFGDNVSERSNGLKEPNSSDCRRWTRTHIDAANAVNLHVLTPPDGTDNVKQEADVRGPCGLTPLMLASFAGGCMDDGTDADADTPASIIITDLLNQGCDIHAQTDHTEETPLHLAARYARVDAAKRLLDHGADANAQDVSGRTPLHSAIAADAMGVFYVLLKHRGVNLNARSGSGATPLMEAARLCVADVVEALIAAEVNVNAADDNGYSALHWAASVDNSVALIALLQAGANRDAQDNQDRTPLYVAAREGNLTCIKILLEHCANRDITDHLDQLPRDAAAERQQTEVLKLLDEFHVSTPPVCVYGRPALPPFASPTSRPKNRRRKATPQKTTGKLVDVEVCKKRQKRLGNSLMSYDQPPSYEASTCNAPSTSQLQQDDLLSHFTDEEWLSRIPPHDAYLSYQFVMSTSSFPTPPSQHASVPTPASSSGLAEHYPTPSPETPNPSPGQWSSESPRSAQSDWSEGISSPPQQNGALPPRVIQIPKQADSFYV